MLEVFNDLVWWQNTLLYIASMYIASLVTLKVKFHDNPTNLHSTDWTDPDNFMPLFIVSLAWPLIVLLLSVILTVYLLNPIRLYKFLDNTIGKVYRAIASKVNLALEKAETAYIKRKTKNYKKYNSEDVA